jgi:hypothetical protein
MLAHWRGSGKSDTPIWTFNMGQSEDLGLCALLKDLRYHREIHVISVGYDMIPGILVVQCGTLDFILHVDGKILFQQIIDDEMRMLMFGGQLNRQQS